jgi:hypothetical protein
MCRFVLGSSHVSIKFRYLEHRLSVAPGRQAVCFCLFRQNGVQRGKSDIRAESEGSQHIRIAACLIVGKQRFLKISGNFASFTEPES